MNHVLTTLKENDQDFEWYPTTREMINAVKRQIPMNAESIMDIGAGDGRVLMAFSEKCEDAKLFSIEKSLILVQEQDAKIIPVGTEFYEQNLSALPSEYIFCNPPYSDYENWMERIISEGYAKEAFLIVPQRWVDSQLIKEALERREAKAEVIYSGDFYKAERQARAQIEIVKVCYKRQGSYGRNWQNNIADPFDQWFEQNIDMFDKINPEHDDRERTSDKQKLELKLRGSDVDEMVESYQADYKHLERNYRAIFELDAALLLELGVVKSTIREGLKKKIRGLKIVYWGILFDRLDAVTSRLSTKSRKLLLDRLVENNTIDFTAHNIRAIALWVINNVNGYLDDQLIDLYKELATKDGATNYKSNQRTWVKHYWRYNFEDYSHFTLDYRIIRVGSQGIYREGNYSRYQYPGNLHDRAHDLIADMIAVFSNLGFKVSDLHSKSRKWKAGKWQDFKGADNKTVFQVKGYLNGNLHIRVMPKAMKALNIKAAQLLKWVGSIEEVKEEMGYDEKTAEKYFNWNQYITVKNLPLLQSSTPETETPLIEEPEYELGENGQTKMKL